MSYPAHPSWQKIYDELSTRGHSPRVFEQADSEFKRQCEAWISRLEEDQVLAFTSDLVKACGEFRPNRFGIMLPDCTDREFPYQILSQALERMGSRREFASKFKDKGYGILSYEDRYAGRVEFHSEQNRWYWELIHKETIVAAGYDTEKRWAWETCIHAYHLRTIEGPNIGDEEE